MYEKLFFLLAIIAFSYFLKLRGIFKEEDSKAFIDYVIYFALPLTVFKSVRELGYGRDVSEVVIFAWGTILLSAVLSLGVGKLLKLKGGRLRAFILVSTFGNTAFMGYPFTYALFGEEGLRYAIIYDQLGSFLAVITLGLFVSVGRFSLREVLLFPPFWGILGGFLLSGIYLPDYVERFIDVSSRSLIPVILFSLGLKLNFRDMKSSVGLSFAVLGLKMIAVPLVLLSLLKLMGAQALHYKVILLESSMPPMVMAAVLAMRYSLDEKLAISSVMLGIFLSFLSVPAIISLL